MVQDPSSNEPEGRQLMVNKRLTKAISAVPRARFQKARPKLPSSKRNDCGSTSVPSKSTAIEGVGFNSAKEKLKSSSEEILSLKSESAEKCKSTQNDNLVSEILETTQNNSDIPKTFDVNQETSKASDFSKKIEQIQNDKLVSKILETPQNDLDVPRTFYPNQETSKASDFIENVKQTQNDELVSKILKTTQNNSDVPKAFDSNQETSKASGFNEHTSKKHITEDHNQNISKVPADFDYIARSTESVESAETSNRSFAVEGIGFSSAKEKLKSSEDILLLKSESGGKSKLTQNYKLVPEILETTQNSLDIPKAFDPGEEISKASDFNENISEVPDDSDSAARSIERIELTHASNRFPTPPVEERNDMSSSVTSTAATDRASKYPHLTSILSKKRMEPKKDTTHRRKRKYWKGDSAPERDKMTMADLIYWNPTSSDPGLKSNIPVNESTANSMDNIPEELPEVDEPESPEEICSSVPKLVISEDGQINIDQVSLVVSRKQVPGPPIGQVVRNEETTYSSFRKRPLTKQWTPKDTFIFYKALSLVGTDFALMEKMLPHRTRRELKLKFKREEKYNIDLINKAMYESQPTFDGKDLEEHIANLNSVSRDFDLDHMQENNQPPVREKKPRGRKCKEASKVLLEDDEQCFSPVQSVNDAGNKKPHGKKSEVAEILADDNVIYSSITKPVNSAENKKLHGRKRKVAEVLSDDSEPYPPLTKCINGAGTMKDEFKNEVRSKRERKVRKLPEGFINIDDIEDITKFIMDNSCVNDSVSEPSSPEANPLDNSDPIKTYSEISVSFDESSLDKICEESTNIQIICLEEGDDVKKGSSLVDDNINQLEKEPETSAFSKKSTNIQIICLKEDSRIENCSHLGGEVNNLLETSAPSEESNNFQIVCVDDIDGGSMLSNEPVLVTDNASSILLPHHIRKVLEHPKSSSQTSSNQNECVIDLVVDNADSNAITSFTHVMANEVVTSLEPATKRKKKVNTTVQKYKKAKVAPKIHRKMNENKESSQPLQPSSLNYTPLEDSLIDWRLEFTPKSNLKTYSKSIKSPPVSQGILINSLQKPLTPEHSNNHLTSVSMSQNSQGIAIPLTPEHSNSLLSSLNVTQNQSLAIPLAPESNSNAPSDSVLFLTKSQSADNLIHMFMYKNPGS